MMKGGFLSHRKHPVKIRRQAFEVKPAQLSLSVLGTVKARPSQEAHGEKYILSTVTVHPKAGTEASLR